MGYTRRQRLFRVELPLAVPLILAGVRLASVTTIGLATVAAVLGNSFGGLGQLITEGLQTFFPTKYLLGAVLSVVAGLPRRRPVRRDRAAGHAVGARPRWRPLMEEVFGFLTDPANWEGPRGIPWRTIEHVAISALGDPRRGAHRAARSGSTSATRAVARASRSTSRTSVGRSRHMPCWSWSCRSRSRWRRSSATRRPSGSTSSRSSSR